MKNAFGIMFHHFHGANHPIGQGSISSEDLDRMITWLKKDFTILNIQEFHEKALKGILASKDTCLTFDDSLLCQFEIARPVIESYGITALFNIYSSAFSARPDPLEIYRYFRSVSYQNFDDFFNDFFVIVREKFTLEYTKGISMFYKERKIYDGDPFYTENDKIYRFFRDRVLSKSNYDQIMINLMNQKMFTPSEVPTKVFMTIPQLEQLNRYGHALGLHSDTHPTQIHLLPQKVQESEYVKNYEFLRNITGFGATMMAHPCGSYSNITLEILNKLGVSLGFRANLSIPYAKSLLEIPREDHANILKKMSVK